MATLLQDGRWQARYRPKGQTPKVWHGPTAEDAERQKEEYLAALNSPPPPIRSTGETTLQDYAKAAWWPTVIASCSDGTEKRYADDWRKHVRPVFGHCRLCDVTYESVATWIAAMTEAGTPPNTIRQRRAVLSMVLNLAVRNGLIPRNPAGDVRVRKAPKRIRIITMEKAIEVLSGVRGTHLEAPVFLSLFLGMSRGEAMGLRWANVDMTSRRINVVEQRRRIRKGAYRVEQTSPKRESRVRSFVLPEALFSVLLSVGDLDSGWVCTTTGHRPANPEHMTERWKDVAPKFGLADWTFHDLRHGAAGLLAACGLDLLTIASILGHASVSTTQIYAAAAESTATRGLERLATAMQPSTSNVDVPLTSGIA